VLNTALSGVDQALWDIKGKMAGMRKGPDTLSGSPFPCRCSANLNRAPSAVHDLLGGKVRKAAPCYVHADGFLPDDPDPATHFDEAKQLMAMGFWHVRLQHNGYGANIPVERPEPEVPRPAGAGDSPTEQVSIYDPIVSAAAPSASSFEAQRSGCTVLRREHPQDVRLYAAPPLPG